MAKGQNKKRTKNQCNMAHSEQRDPTTTTPGYDNTTEAQESDLKFYLIKMIDAFKEEMNKSPKEIQENNIKQVEG